MSKRWKFTGLLLLSLIFLISINNVMQSSALSFEYVYEEGQYVVYYVEDNDDTEYRKYVIADLFESPTNVTMNFTEYISAANEFGSTPSASENYTLNGDLAKDIFYDPTIVSFSLEDGLSFEGKETALEQAVIDYTGEPSAEVEISTSCEGLCLNIVGKVSGIKVLELNAVYATTGLLLYAEYSMLNTDTLSTDTGLIEIQKDDSTIPGADEYSPKIKEELDKPSVFDLQLFLIIMGVVIVVGVTPAVIYKKKHK